MQLFTMFAVYFIFWWITLFAVLPFGLKTQQENNDVVLGTIESAPSNFRGSASGNRDVGRGRDRLCNMVCCNRHFWIGF